jgi:hypothetical protein
MKELKNAVRPILLGCVVLSGCGRQERSPAPPSAIAAMDAAVTGFYGRVLEGLAESPEIFSHAQNAIRMRLDSGDIPVPYCLAIVHIPPDAVHDGQIQLDWFVTEGNGPGDVVVGRAETEIVRIRYPSTWTRPANVLERSDLERRPLRTNLIFISPDIQSEVRDNKYVDPAWIVVGEAAVPSSGEWWVRDGSGRDLGPIVAIRGRRPPPPSEEHAAPGATHGLSASAVP